MRDKGGMLIIPPYELQNPKAKKGEVKNKLC